jgi:hypothetical protein
MSELARQLIEREKRERTGYLNLGNCGLTKLPDLSDLEGLETLILSDTSSTILISTTSETAAKEADG